MQERLYTTVYNPIHAGMFPRRPQGDKRAAWTIIATKWNQLLTTLTRPLNKLLVKLWAIVAINEIRFVKFGLLFCL